jgi:hypothetical protein
VSRRRPPICAALAALALLVAGCGGDDDEDGGGAAATAGETIAIAGDGTLDQAAWDEYVAARDEARAVNDEAVATFRRCRDLLGTAVPAAEVEECLGTAAADVVAQGREVMEVLDGLPVEEGSACAAATTQLSGNVKLYTSAVNSIQLTVSNSRLPTSQDVGAATQMLVASREAADEFERACAPA